MAAPIKYPCFSVRSCGGRFDDGVPCRSGNKEGRPESAFSTTPVMDASFELLQFFLAAEDEVINGIQSNGFTRLHLVAIEESVATDFS